MNISIRSFTAALLGVAATFLAPAEGQAQKPALDSSAIYEWPSVSGEALSPDGRYAAYSVKNVPVGGKTGYIVALKGDWKVTLPDVEDIAFSADNRIAVYMAAKNRLAIQPLTQTAVQTIDSVQSFKLIAQGKQAWLVYQRSVAPHALVVYDPVSDARDSISSVVDFWVSDDSSRLVVETKDSSSAGTHFALSWRELKSRADRPIWSGTGKVSAPVLSRTGEQVAFRVVDSAAGTDSVTVWYANAADGAAKHLTDDHAPGLDSGFHVGDPRQFTGDGRRLLLDIVAPPPPKVDTSLVSVDVWSYRDVPLQSQQVGDAQGRIGRPDSYLAVLDLATAPRIRRLQAAGEHPEIGGPAVNRFAVFDSSIGDGDERHWQPLTRPRYDIVSLETGERHHAYFGNYAEMSPNERYLLGHDLKWEDVYAYDTQTGVTHNLTASLPIPAVDRGVSWEPQSNREIITAGWLPQDSAVVVYDRFDIWQLDPTGKKAPICLTNGYGRRHNIVFRYAQQDGGRTPDLSSPLLTAFDETTKNNGYYRLSQSSTPGDPQLVTMGRYAYAGHLGEFGDWSVHLQKARDGDVYLLPRESASQSTNLFWTTDFKTLHPVSDVYPEKKYNWMTSELHHFTTLNGYPVQGALYRPENFDSTKKYPVIIHYYEERSQELNQYKYPRGPANGGEINIPWFVSHGYVIFLIDVYDTQAQAGQDAYNSIVAAAQYLQQFPWADSARMGIQGHSFGGFYTEYVITHTHRFAAAMESCGVADLISQYGDLWGASHSNGTSTEGHAEQRQFRMAATLWERPDVYLDNSPILRADQVTTPVFMMANHKDGNVDFSQGLEFFMAMRRLHKKAWMVQYDSGGHGVDDRKDAVDYLVRMTQFFDYYLKGAPPPKWMTEGVPARMKQIDTGLELDTSGAVP